MRPLASEETKEKVRHINGIEETLDFPGSAHSTAFTA
jgi:hypothetical protein